MRISVKVKPRARHEGVTRLDDSHYAVSVNAPPADGKANEAVAEALAEFFGLSKSKVRLVSGQTSRQKVFDIGG